MKECGGCTLCCVLPPVGEMDKPPNFRCKHACSGCDIYETRPNECRAFECLWRFGKLHDRMRPDRCGVIFELHKAQQTVIAMVDPFRPDAWQNGITGTLIERMLVDDYTVWVVIGKEKHLLLPEGRKHQQSLDQLKEIWRRRWQPQPTQPISLH